MTLRIYSVKKPFAIISRTYQEIMRCCRGRVEKMAKSRWDARLSSPLVIRYCKHSERFGTIVLRLGHFTL